MQQLVGVATAALAFTGGPLTTHHVHHRAAPPQMMPSPLRFRQRIRGAGSWARGVVVSTQNILLEKTPAALLRGENADLGRGDDDEEAPPILSDEICLVPGRPVVRVEVAPGNARRIFTGIDIVVEDPAALELVWNMLTDYPNLADGIPNLVSNKVLSTTVDPPGARLEQLGAAKLAPMVTFTATTTLDVVEYMGGLPPYMEADHLKEEEEAEAAADETAGFKGADGSVKKASSDSAAVRKYGEGMPLTENVFPRPYMISQLPHRDITMQGVKGIGDFSFYQVCEEESHCLHCISMHLACAFSPLSSEAPLVTYLAGRMAAAGVAGLCAARLLGDAPDL